MSDAINRVGDMTQEELYSLIETMIERKLNEVTPAFDLDRVRQTLEALDSHRWTPPPGVKSPRQLLREDRDV